MKTAVLKQHRLIVVGLFTATLLVVAACGGEKKHDGKSHDEDANGKEGVTASHPDVKPAILAGEPVYFCPMHPDVVSAEQGQCDPCGGMELVEHKGKVYGCSVHPDEVSTDIESDCRVCGMDVDELKKREAEEAQSKPTA